MSHQHVKITLNEDDSDAYLETDSGSISEEEDLISLGQNK